MKIKGTKLTATYRVSVLAEKFGCKPEQMRSLKGCGTVQLDKQPADALIGAGLAVAVSEGSPKKEGD